MRIMTRVRRATAVVAIASVAFTEACHSYQRPLVSPVPSGARIQVIANRRMELFDGPRLAATPDACRAKMVRGTVEASRGDTLTLYPVTRLHRGTPSSACDALQRVTFLAQPDATILTVRRISKGRTTALVIGLALVATLGIAAATAGSSDWNVGSAGTGGF
jgi:hypothetical protein